MPSNDDKPTDDTQREIDFWKPVDDYIKSWDPLSVAKTPDEMLTIVAGNVRAAVAKFAKPIAEELQNALAANDQLGKELSIASAQLDKLESEANALRGENASLKQMLAQRPSIPASMYGATTPPPPGVKKAGINAIHINSVRDPQCVTHHRVNCDCTGDARGPIGYTVTS